MQEEELTNEGRHNLLSLHKQADDKRAGIAESLHVCITRARLTACEVGIRNIISLENTPPLLFVHRIFERLRYQTNDTEVFRLLVQL